MELKDVPGIGDKTLSLFTKAGIQSVPDLLTIFPRTYRTYHAKSVKEATVGDWVVLKGTISRATSHHTSRTTTQVASFWDTSGSLTLRWFNMPYIVRSISPTSSYLIKGVITEFAGRRQIISPLLTKVDEGYELQDQIVPIYSAKDGIKPWVLRQKVGQTLSQIDQLDDPLPSKIVEKYKLISYQQAIESIHAPKIENDIAQAVYRLSFQELYGLQLASIRLRKSKLKKGYLLSINKELIQWFINSLPFEPTHSQSKAIQEIVGELQQSQAMYRLLQGEVGSGKTIVAAAAAIATYSAGYRTVLMAPTQILAVQLYENFLEYCKPIGMRVSLITAKSKGDDQADVLVGTQALLNNINLDRVGLVIIDEQHRFGVEQREKLAIGETVPHLLQMTATPIPRSVAQTIFHHLDITRLLELPKNRLPVKTYLVPESKRVDSYDWIRHEVMSHHNQVFIVVPLIEIAEENEVAPLKSLKELEVALKRVFPNLSIDIMHGKMKESEKLEHMSRFKIGITQILVATSMIEVGLDIPAANIIVIEDAERFGLAQLHQLRGRVGRGGGQGHCLLFSQNKSEHTKERLAYFIRETNGEKLAQFDLRSRGPGELFGTLQSGFFNLRLGSMYDEKLLQNTYQAAKETLLNQPSLAK